MDFHLQQVAMGFPEFGGAAQVEDFYGGRGGFEHFREFAETLATVLGGGGGGACVVGQVVEEAGQGQVGGPCESPALTRWGWGGFWLRMNADGRQKIYFAVIGGLIGLSRVFTLGPQTRELKKV